MKWVAIVFLIGNVVLFGWQFNQHVNEKAADVVGLPPLPPQTPRLRLISELPELPARRATSASIRADGEAEKIIETVDLSSELNDFGEPSNSCIEVGPFSEEEHLENFRNWLRTRAIEVHTRKETVRQRRFFWIYLEAVSDEDAKNSLSDLKRRGVTDYLLVRHGGLKNAISLGLFRSQDSVNRRLAEMNQQGYQPVVVPKFESTDNYYVEAVMAVGSEDTTDLPADLIGEATLEPSDCASIPTKPVIDEL